MSESVARETGDRTAFLARIRDRQGPAPAGGPHPPPAPPDVVPEMRYRNLDGVTDRDDLLSVFAATAHAAGSSCTIVPVPATEHQFVHDRAPTASGPAGVVDVLQQVVGDHDVAIAVVSREPEAVAAGEALRRLGVRVDDYTPAAAARADLAVTSATHGIAATGSVVVDTAAAGSRAVSLLPRVHVCVLPAERIVPSPADVLRHREPDGLPSCRVIITGPSRTGDIEQRLIQGAHGPVALHVVVTNGV